MLIPPRSPFYNHFMDGSTQMVLAFHPIFVLLYPNSIKQNIPLHEVACGPHHPLNIQTPPCTISMNFVLLGVWTDLDKIPSHISCLRIRGQTQGVKDIKLSWHWKCGGDWWSHVKLSTIQVPWYVGSDGFGDPTSPLQILQILETEGGFDIKA